MVYASLSTFCRPDDINSTLKCIYPNKVYIELNKFSRTIASVKRKGTQQVFNINSIK